MKRLKKNILLKFAYRLFWMLIYGLKKPFLKLRYGAPKVCDLEDTIQEIVNEKKSVSRFGDGELRWALGLKNDNSFQEQDSLMAQRLRQIISNDDDSLMVCIPDVFQTLNLFTWDNAGSWAKLLSKNYGRWLNFVGTNKQYFDANFTRPYMQQRDKTKASHYFNQIKKIWNGKKVLIIEGEKTRFGVGNDLLANSNMVRRILCPAENAFDNYDKILNFSADLSKNFDVILIALGPTATILSADLSKDGCFAIDIGHLDIEYEWYLRNVKKKVAIPGKFVNESISQKYLENKNLDLDINYKNQIIFQIE